MAKSINIKHSNKLLELSTIFNKNEILYILDPPNQLGEFCINFEKMDQVMSFVEPCRQFAKDSLRLVKRCTKPDRKEFQKIAMATAIGFAIMGFIGFFVKLIHIPINNIIVGS
ncbi:Protein transport protein Sec61 subunit gamma [Araneus ventricosus]|uniref:Protein transport protein Sec61 subunit gamma n=2 Tax=Araneidae TaxID=6913 RepID=A0A4Y2ICV3_ARAVE|nr:Protein transport protein Sec61 subunit gamma [Araneus ventricosus]